MKNVKLKHSILLKNISIDTTAIFQLVFAGSIIIKINFTIEETPEMRNVSLTAITKTFLSQIYSRSIQFYITQY